MRGLPLVKVGAASVLGSEKLVAGTKRWWWLKLRRPAGRIQARRSRIVRWWWICQEYVHYETQYDNRTDGESRGAPGPKTPAVEILDDDHDRKSYKPSRERRHQDNCGGDDEPLEIEVSIRASKGRLACGDGSNQDSANKDADEGVEQAFPPRQHLRQLRKAMIVESAEWTPSVSPAGLKRPGRLQFLTSLVGRVRWPMRRDRWWIASR